jgi:hypothetical protein
MLLERYYKMKTSAGYLRSYGVNPTISDGEIMKLIKLNECIMAKRRD